MRLPSLMVHRRKAVTEFSGPESRHLSKGIFRLVLNLFILMPEWRVLYVGWHQTNLRLDDMERLLALEPIQPHPL
jgi:hypothetical protein